MWGLLSPLLFSLHIGTEGVFGFSFSDEHCTLFGHTTSFPNTALLQKHKI